MTKLRKNRETPIIAELEKVADIPSKEIEKAKSDAEAAIEAAKESDKDQLVKRLDNIQKIFSSLKESTASALSLGKLIGEILLAVQKFNF
jgi:F0F1-type ATP synthase epsilon subunit